MSLRGNERSGTSRAHLEKSFRSVVDTPAATRDQLAAEAGIAESLLEAADTIDVTLENGREKSLAITKLEEAFFWARKAVFE